GLDINRAFAPTPISILTVGGVQHSRACPVAGTTGGQRYPFRCWPRSPADDLGVFFTTPFHLGTAAWIVMGAGRGRGSELAGRSSQRTSLLRRFSLPLVNPLGLV